LISIDCESPNYDICRDDTAKQMTLTIAFWALSPPLRPAKFQNLYPTPIEKIG